MSSTGVQAEFPHVEGIPPAPRKSWGERLMPIWFLLPAAFFLGVWVIWPTISTAWRSLWSNRGDEFVWLDNYEEIFTEDRLLTALKNNALWVLIIPVTVTAVGLVLAVLVERIRWSTAFKICVFMPLAISLFAVGVTWRIMYQQDPDRGAINAGLSAVRGVFVAEGVLEDARPSSDALTGSPEQGFELDQNLQPGDTALLGLTAIATRELPESAEQATQPEALQGGITGVVWRDFSPSGGSPGRIDDGELGIPGATVELRTRPARSSTAPRSDGRRQLPVRERGRGSGTGGGGRRRRSPSPTRASTGSARA